MFLSKLELNGARRGTGRLLASPQRMHAAVAASFPAEDAVDAAGAGARILWRVDAGSHNPVVYVVSPETPDFTHIVEQAGWPTKVSWGVADYAPLLDRLAEGQVWQFRLAANPVHNVAGARGTRGKRVPHVTAAHQEEWLLGKADQIGAAFDVESPLPGSTDSETGSASSAPSFRIEERKVVRFARRKPANGKVAKTVTITQARFDGLLRVTDPESLRKALVQGIGPAKGYGCGLLTLAPVPRS
ncbi:type I-E CRISPR-associated protein Cas6/Cse3/CasE [Brevibacterium moorei]|uniref:type I-E CRISPR-associated protein Cas6/Cse3/CasE n=1 Tax=Brevibacterium moorei TaxID=2968457 RepID=UPI00211CA374|nr:type I-E CRISPR-associated protein Cas6/Cse3/CasE [Brevibacterium sp. 68QC2CO]MCQ9385375.1 type I-E CRISPR-associated protein Cas6/Cse3/CasE [Brevibacterium sp. 68QC2CO]